MINMVCTSCKKDKTLDDFQKDARYRSGHVSRCKSCKNKQTVLCARNRRARDPRHYLAQELKRNYNLSLEEYDLMVKKQDNRCAICKSPPSGATKQNHRLHVDHCHETEVIRGLLCGRCNSAIGLLLHNEENLQNAILYLQGAISWT